jgi:hypothetical protein
MKKLPVSLARGQTIGYPAKSFQYLFSNYQDFSSPSSCILIYHSQSSNYLSGVSLTYLFCFI